MVDQDVYLKSVSQPCQQYFNQYIKKAKSLGKCYVLVCVKLSFLKSLTVQSFNQSEYLTIASLGSLPRSKSKRRPKSKVCQKIISKLINGSLSPRSSFEQKLFTLPLNVPKVKNDRYGSLDARHKSEEEIVTKPDSMCQSKNSLIKPECKNRLKARYSLEPRETKIKEDLQIEDLKQFNH